MSSILRTSSSAMRSASRVRAFSSTITTRKDLVQDLYLKEIKSYKPAPQPKDAHVGVVKTLSPPPPPKAPALPSDLASELSAYDATEPTKAEAKSAAGEEHVEGSGAEAFLQFLEADIPQPDAHHH